MNIKGETLTLKYARLLEIIKLQKTSLKEEDIEALERLTQEKADLVKKIMAAEGALEGGEKKASLQEVEKKKRQAAKEDREFVALLRSKEEFLKTKLAELKGAKKNLTQMRAVYTKKFTGSPLFNQQG
jgi:myosin heavy subunit